MQAAIEACIDDLHNEIAELRDLLLTGNVLAQNKKEPENLQVPLNINRTVDWRTKKAELERKYSKGKVRDELVKEISSPSELFKE